jgi:hypothetical protein
MLIGCGTGVAVGNDVKVVVGSGVKVKVVVSDGGIGVALEIGVACGIQPINKLVSMINNKIFFILSPI